MGSLLSGIVDTLNRIRVGSLSLRIEEFESHQFHIPRYSGDSDAIVTNRSNDPRNVSPMT